MAHFQKEIMQSYQFSLLDMQTWQFPNVMRHLASWEKACDTLESFLISLSTCLVVSSHSQNAKYLISENVANSSKKKRKIISEETFHFCSKKTHSLAIKKSWLVSVETLSKALFSIA